MQPSEEQRCRAERSRQAALALRAARMAAAQRQGGTTASGTSISSPGPRSAGPADQAGCQPREAASGTLRLASRERYVLEYSDVAGPFVGGVPLSDLVGARVDEVRGDLTKLLRFRREIGGLADGGELRFSVDRVELSVWTGEQAVTPLRGGPLTLHQAREDEAAPIKWPQPAPLAPASPLAAGSQTSTAASSTSAESGLGLPVRGHRAALGAASASRPPAEPRTAPAAAAGAAGLGAGDGPWRTKPASAAASTAAPRAVRGDAISWDGPVSALKEVCAPPRKRPCTEGAGLAAGPSSAAGSRAAAAEVPPSNTCSQRMPAKATGSSTTNSYDARGHMPPSRPPQHRVPPAGFSASAGPAPAPASRIRRGMAKAVVAVLDADSLEVEVTSPDVALLDRLHAALDGVLGADDAPGSEVSSPDSRTATRRSFPARLYHAVRDVLFHHLQALDVRVLPDLVEAVLVRRAHDVVEEVDPALPGVPAAQRARLLDYQKEAVVFALQRGGRALLADEMGLGKTLQALAVAAHYRDDWPLLVVCPASLCCHWRQELRTHLPEVQPYLASGRGVVLDGQRVVVMSYDSMTSLKDALLRARFGVVIMDESHNLKNYRALRTTVGLEVARASKRCVLLSGTPALSCPKELFCQLQCVRPDVFDSFMEFAERYCAAKKERFGWNFRGSSNLQELSVLLRHLVMVQRSKEEVANHLPAKCRTAVVLEEGADEDLRQRIASVEAMGDAVGHPQFLQLYHRTAQAKLPAIRRFLVDHLARGEKVLVFAHHALVLDTVCRVAAEQRVTCVRIDGGVAMEARAALCSQFQQDQHCQLAVLAIKAAGCGLTLTAASSVVFAELYWNPGELLQAEDRAHRLGQRCCVAVQYLLQPGTADELMWPLIRDKLAFLNEARLSHESFGCELTARTAPPAEASGTTPGWGSHEDQDDDSVLLEVPLSPGDWCAEATAGSQSTGHLPHHHEEEWLGLLEDMDPEAAPTCTSLEPPSAGS